MNYQETLDYLYNSVPMFQQVGSSAYKEGLENTYALDEYLGHPHTAFQSIHMAGTNAIAKRFLRINDSTSLMALEGPTEKVPAHIHWLPFCNRPDIGSGSTLRPI